MVPRLHTCHGVVEVGRPLDVDIHVRGLDRAQSHRGVEEHTGEPHAARGGPEHVGVGVGVDLGQARRRPQGEGVDEGAEAAVVVVILAVDVGCDGPADRDVPRARRDRYEPAQGHDRSHEGVEADARVQRDDAGGQVEGVDSSQVRHVEDQTARILGGVAVPFHLLK